MHLIAILHSDSLPKQMAAASTYVTAAALDRTLLDTVLCPKCSHRIIRKSGVETLYANTTDRWLTTIIAGARRIFTREQKCRGWCNPALL